jgi:hypothetical protein
MKSRLLLVALLFGFSTQVGRVAEEGENPFRKATVGEFVAYKMSTKIGDMAIDGTMKQSITAKTDKEVTVKTTGMLLGNALPAQEEKIDLTKAYDPVKAAITGKNKGKFEKTSEGKEKVKLGEKTYECTWVKGKVVAEAAGLKIESDVQMWFSPTIPLGGLAKMEMKSNLADITMEFTESGKDK